MDWKFRKSRLTEIIICILKSVVSDSLNRKLLYGKSFYLGSLLSLTTTIGELNKS